MADHISWNLKLQTAVQLQCGQASPTYCFCTKLTLQTAPASKANLFCFQINWLWTVPFSLHWLCSEHGKMEFMENGISRLILHASCFSYPGPRGFVALRGAEGANEWWDNLWDQGRFFRVHYTINGGKRWTAYSLSDHGWLKDHSQLVSIWWPNDAYC